MGLPPYLYGIQAIVSIDVQIKNETSSKNRQAIEQGLHHDCSTCGAQLQTSAA